MADSKPKSLSSLNKPDLLEAAEDLQLQVQGLQDELLLLRTPAKAKALAAPEPGVVMVIHLGGVAWNGTERKIVRCAPTGELAEAWMVVVAGRLLLNDGKGSIPVRDYNHLAAALQRRAQWPKAAAIKAALEA